jgi:isoquinoline 1-oxidoreductase beta subunit
MSRVVKVSRRDVAKGALAGSAFVLGLRAGSRDAAAAPAAPPKAARRDAKAFAPNVFVSIDETGLVTIVAHRAEMGTGIRTGLPMVLADELGADWKRVRVIQAQGDKKYGAQNTDESRSTWEFYQPMRIAGASARQMLESAAARAWKVPADRCRARDHAVEHVGDGRTLGFGELVKLAAALPVPAPRTLRFKAPHERSLIGKSTPVVDLDDIVRGKAVYGLDVSLPGMKYASIERCPVYGGRVKSFDARDALAVAGVVRVVALPATPMPSGYQPLGGIAVVADNTWAALQGRRKLKVEWDLGPNATHDSRTYRGELEATAKQPGKVVRKQGDVNAALASAARRVSADYFVPYYVQAPMEVPAAAASFARGRCEVWCATQTPQEAREAVAEALRLKEADVTVNATLLGGGFGRKSKPDYVAEAALLARAIGAPVKLMWTREDDIRNGYYHAACAQHLEAGLDKDGRVLAWLHRTVFPPIEATFQPNTRYGSAGELQKGVVDMPYAIPNVQCENGPAGNHVRIGWYRSVNNIPHAFAVCSFADELAAAAGKDPVEYLRQLLGEPR